MQENNSIPQQIISFFKNKFDIFKNKLISKPTLPTVPTVPTTPIQTCIHTSTTTPSNSSIYISSFNINHHNNIEVLKTKIQPDIITVTTTMTTTVTTIQNTQSKEVEPTLEPKPIQSTYKQYIDCSKYSDNIISSLIDNIIDNIELQDYISNKQKNEKYLQECVDFYDNQLDYSHMRDTLSSNVFNEFEEIINNILTPESNYLINLYQLKIYQDDLVNMHTRYGVFQTNNFIIKIDDQSDIFASELELVYRIGKGVIYPYNIVLPYYVHIVKKNKDKNRKKIKIMHFSIQPRIKNTIALHKWINLSDNRFYNVTYYIKMCITISKSILFIHSHNIVHGDVKPDNILIELSSNTPYIIDFGLSGIHSLSQGTGGTRPFCSPETNNTSDSKDDTYTWTKNNKQHDLWSIAFIFSTIIIFKKSYNYYSDYPRGYFTDNKYINLHFLNRIPLQFREPFVLVLSKKSDINLSNFISLLEHALTLPSLPDLHYPSHYHLDAPALV
jgi:hypothetical protein